MLCKKTSTAVRSRYTETRAWSLLATTGEQPARDEGPAVKNKYTDKKESGHSGPKIVKEKKAYSKSCHREIPEYQGYREDAKRFQKRQKKVQTPESWVKRTLEFSVAALSAHIH